MALTNEEIKFAEALKKSGKDNTEVMRIIAKQRRGETNTPQQQARPVGEDVAIGFAKGAGQSVKFASDIAARGAAGAVGGPIFNALVPGASSALVGIKDRMQQAVGLTDENLKAENSAQMVGKGVEIAAEFATPFVMSRFAAIMARAPQAAAPIAESTIASKAKGVVESVKDFAKNPKLAFAKQNVSPQLESSAERLFLSGTERLKSPVATYDNYVNQAKQAISDIKVDPPLAVVGESIGDAFRKVVADRRNVGNIMGEELKKVANVQTNILPTVDTFVNDLAEQGLKYDRVTKELRQTASQVKMTAEDMGLLEKYASELQRLGSKPTIADLDAFMSRIPSEIDVYKASKNITGSTNGERIIKKSLADLREQFSPTINPDFAPYYEARKKYAQLSNFIEDGGRFLGKVTQSGDFEKDASLAKSSVQSLLNNGKKDWLIELEQLSGYQALDDSVIALQAMKDAGDFRGISLLETLSSGAPSSQAGFTQKAIDYAMQKVGRRVAGTPEEQTRAFLQALKEGSAREGTQNAFAGGFAGVDPTTGEFNAKDAAIGVGAAALGIKLTKAMEPKNVAASLNAGEYKALKEFTVDGMDGANAQISVKSFMNLADTLRNRKIDIDKMSLPQLRDYVRAIVQEFEESL